MSETTPEQIAAIKALCTTLGPTVKEATVNDWGRFGNFDIFVTPVEHTRHTTVKLIALVKKSLPKGAHLRQCFPPTAVRESWSTHGERFSRKSGYDRSYWVFDIDFQYYDPESNRFQKQLSQEAKL